MTANLAALAYLVAGVLFILALRGLGIGEGQSVEQAEGEDSRPLVGGRIIAENAAAIEDRHRT